MLAPFNGRRSRALPPSRARLPGLSMANDLTLEICVESAEWAAAAERSGADRIELCSSLSRGGVTPDAELMRATRRQVRIPIYVLIRPHADHELCSDSDFESMKREVCLAKDLGMDGVVVGILGENMRVDRKRTALLVGLADPLPVTFHRAFDLCGDLQASMEAVIETGAQRILTSGGKMRASDALPFLAELVASAGDRIVIMPGGGIRTGNVRRVMRETGAKELHTSLAPSNNRRKIASHGSPQTNHENEVEFESRVRDFVQAVHACSSELIRPK